MPTVRVPFGDGYAILTHQDGWKVGDPPPADPNALGDWQAWAEVQHKGGLRAKQCGQCLCWKFPQELSERVTTHTHYRDRAMTKPITSESPVCLKCDKRLTTNSGEKT